MSKIFVFDEGIFFSLYDEGSMVRFINVVNNKTVSKQFTKDDYFIKLFKKMNKNINYLNTYIEKYPNEKEINKIYLDFDGNPEQVKYDVIRVVNKLREKNIGYFVENSTNKGLHLILFLDKNYNFKFHNQFRYNNKMFKIFIFNLIGGDYTTLDKVNMGMKTNIRMIFSIHPKTNCQVLPVDYYNPKEINNKYINKCYIEAKNSIPEIKYKGEWKKININDSYKSPLIDLRELSWDVVYDDGRRKWCRCPFHNDKHASLVVYEAAAYCMVDGKIEFETIKKYFNL